jgi:hypothetical protein
MRFLAPALVCTLLMGAGGQAPPKGEVANAKIRIEATAYLTKEHVKTLLGAELEEGMVVVEVKVTPLGEGPLAVSRDDFFLRSDKDGQRSSPYSAAQVAGSSVMRISSVAGAGGMIASENRGPVWGGMGGPMGRLGGGPGGVGNTGTIEEARASVEQTGNGKENPLLKVLEAKIFPDAETKEPVSGFLYLLLEGKHKVKQLELHYKGPAGKLGLRFIEPK